MIASSSAITTRTGLLTGVEPLTYRLRRGGRGSRGRQLVRHAIEQCILVALELFDRPAQGVALPQLRIGMSAHLVRFGLGERRFGDERPQPRVLGLGNEDRALLLGDRELGAQALEPVTHIDQSAFQQGLGHGTNQSTGPTPVWQRWWR